LISYEKKISQQHVIILFLLCFNFFSHCNSLGLYRGNMSVDKIPWKFTDGNIPSVFSFVFIDFLVVKVVARVRHCDDIPLHVCIWQIWGDKKFLFFISGMREWESSPSILVTRNPNWSKRYGTWTDCVKGRC